MVNGRVMSHVKGAWAGWWVWLPVEVAVEAERERKEWEVGVEWQGEAARRQAAAAKAVVLVRRFRPRACWSIHRGLCLCVWVWGAV